MAHGSLPPRPAAVIPTMALADHLIAEQIAVERGHKRGLAAAASMVEIVWHEIDGTVLERSAAYEIARRAVSAYIQQIAQMTGGTR